MLAGMAEGARWVPDARACPLASASIGCFDFTEPELERRMK